MKLRTQLIAAIVVFVVLLVFLSGFIISTNQQVDSLSRQQEIANNIAIETGELGYLANDYILHREPQEADRWNAKYASISDNIARLSVDQPEQQAIVGNLAANLLNTKSVFDDIVSSPLQPGGADTGFIDIMWNRIAVQDQGMIFDANRLAGLIREQEIGVRGVMLFFIVALMGAFGALLLTGYFFVYRRILRSLADIQQGAGSVGSGNFSHSINESHDDEIGDLARSFNRMTVNLRGITASKADLEREVIVRKKAEEELGEINEELNATNEELTATQEELHQNLDELTNREKELNSALAEKEALLSEIHHRVKNNLAAFISLLSLQGSIEDTPEGKRLKLDLQNRARSMALVHETLYKTHMFEAVDMGMYLDTLLDQIAGSFQMTKSVKRVVDAHGVMLDISRATPAGLIVNELVTNSFKYAFPESFDSMAVRHAPPSISITLSKTDGMFELTFRDNGVGLPPEIDLATTQTLGLKLVNFLAKHQMRANIEVHSEGGTEFMFRFRG